MGKKSDRRGNGERRKHLRRASDRRMVEEMFCAECSRKAEHCAQHFSTQDRIQEQEIEIARHKEHNQSVDDKISVLCKKFDNFRKDAHEEHLEFQRDYKSIQKEYKSMIPKWMFLFAMSVIIAVMGINWKELNGISKQLREHINWGAKQGVAFDYRLKSVERHVGKQLRRGDMEDSGIGGR